MSDLYQKITTPFKRNFETRRLIIGDWADPILEQLKDMEWTFWEKIDGTCTSVSWNEWGFYYGGKSNKTDIPAPLLEALKEMFEPLEEKFKEKFAEPDYDPDSDSFFSEPYKDVQIWGEGFGPKIQKGGGLYGDKVSFIVFDIKINGVWLEQDTVTDICRELGLRRVPQVGSGKLSDAIQIVSAGLQSTFGDFEAEGIIARPVFTLTDRRGKRIITKIKHVDFR